MPKPPVSSRRFHLPAVFAVLATATFAAPAHAQYFGRNKVQYERHNFRVLPSAHFDIYFYPAESLATADAARMAERWYHRHSALFGFKFAKNPLIFYADPPDFQQSNVVEERISQGTGAITEGTRDRVIMPFSGSSGEDDHVLGHELVHVFQYHIAAAEPRGIRAMQGIPLWLIEGMAEYLSLGRDDPNTAMWLRDALRRNDLPTIEQLNTDPRYFPYRFGQALWAYIGGRWGDDAVPRVFRAALRVGWRKGIESTLHLPMDSLSAQWHDAIRQEYGGVAGRTAPDQVGRAIAIAKRHSDQNVSPSLSPDGRRVAFFSSRSLFGFDIYIADAATGAIVKRLTSVTGDPHYDALSFISSAGTWSPDGRQFAFVVFADGNNELDVVDVASGETTRRIRPPGIGAMSDPAWSPDGSRIVFTGVKGGIGDLYAFDLAKGTTEQLTTGRDAELQPAWSPDGRTIAFTTDRGPGTDFGALTHGPMRLALMDVATRRITLLDAVARGKAINPQFSPDGRALYFVSDRDGVSDLYRLSLADGAVTRLTSVATGVSGITALSPAISVARGTGELALSVFDHGGYGIRAMRDPGAVGVAATVQSANAGLLPPVAAISSSAVERGLDEPRAGLPASAPTATRPYDPSLGVTYARTVGVGATFGGPYGAGIAGGLALGFTDMLGNRLLQGVIQGQGQVQDIGGQLFYLNRANRWNVGGEVHHAPLVAAVAGYQNATFNVGGQAVPGTVVTRYLQREFADGGQVITQYPLSSTRRLEFAAGFDHLGFSTQVESLYVAGGAELRYARANVPASSPLNFGTASAAYVGDYSFFGFASPVAGGRYRVAVKPYVGSLNFATVLGDYRRYFYMRPFTLAIRAIHVGRYGADGDNRRLQPMFLGDPSLVRGYEASDFSASECQVSSGTNRCPVFTRLIGSRVGIVNAEFRIPLLGPEELAILPSRYLPVEVAPFVDAGAAWTASEAAAWRFDRNTSDRVPVVSAGVAARFNVFGAIIAEVYWATPFQRPGRGGHFGFQLAPGW